MDCGANLTKGLLLEHCQTKRSISIGYQWETSYPRPAGGTSNISDVFSKRDRAAGLLSRGVSGEVINKYRTMHALPAMERAEHRDYFEEGKPPQPTIYLLLYVGSVVGLKLCPPQHHPMSQEGRVKASQACSGGYAVKHRMGFLGIWLPLTLV